LGVYKQDVAGIPLNLLFLRCYLSEFEGLVGVTVADSIFEGYLRDGVVFWRVFGGTNEESPLKGLH